MRLSQGSVAARGHETRHRLALFTADGKMLLAFVGRGQGCCDTSAATQLSGPKDDRAEAANPAVKKHDSGQAGISAVGVAAGSGRSWKGQKWRMPSGQGQEAAPVQGRVWGCTQGCSASVRPSTGLPEELGTKESWLVLWFLLTKWGHRNHTVDGRRGLL